MDAAVFIAVAVALLPNGVIFPLFAWYEYRKAIRFKRRWEHSKEVIAARDRQIRQINYELERATARWQCAETILKRFEEAR